MKVLSELEKNVLILQESTFVFSEREGEMTFQTKSVDSTSNFTICHEFVSSF